DDVLVGVLPQGQGLLVAGVLGQQGLEVLDGAGAVARLVGGDGLLEVLIGLGGRAARQEQGGQRQGQAGQRGTGEGRGRGRGAGTAVATSRPTAEAAECRSWRAFLSRRGGPVTPCQGGQGDAEGQQAADGAGQPQQGAVAAAQEQGALQEDEPDHDGDRGHP